MPKANRTLDGILNRIARGLSGTAPDPGPDTEPNPQIILDHIAEVSKNARATGFGLLGLLVFVGITLLAHKDADFFAYGVETKLPLINVDIPVKAFFVFAPALVAALYIYLHLYLMTLWDALGKLRQDKGAAPIANRVFPWLISHAALCYRNHRRDDGSAAPHALGWVVVAGSIVLGWLFGLLVLGGLWLRSMPAHDEWLTLWIAFCMLVAAMTGLTGFRTARARMEGKPRENTAGAHLNQWKLAGVLAVLLAFLSVETTETGWVVPLYPANLVEADLTRKPPGWLPFDIWLEEFEPKYRARKDIADETDLGGNWAFIAEATRRYNAPLSAPDLKGADLRNANMRRAFLPGAGLRRAEMQGAVLRGAQMQGTASRAAQMQGTDLREVKMQGADLREVEMQGADLRDAQMQGVVLSGAELQNADCSSADLRGALLQSANMTCRNLKQSQLQDAVGDKETALPDGLTVASCIETLPKTAIVLAYYPNKGSDVRISRAQARDALLCDAGEKPFRID